MVRDKDLRKKCKDLVAALHEPLQSITEMHAVFEGGDIVLTDDEADEAVSCYENCHPPLQRAAAPVVGQEC